MAVQAGDIVDAYCSLCKLQSEVQVVAAVGDEIVTVTCRTCGTSQRFLATAPERKAGRGAAGRRVVDVEPDRGRRGRRSRNAGRRVTTTTGRMIPDIPPPMPRRSPEAPTTEPKKRSSDLFRLWDKATDGADSRYARPHRKTESYDIGELVLHHEHGMGVVMERQDDGELKVLFKEGFELLPSVPPAEVVEA